MNYYKEPYEAPKVEPVEIKTEGMVCASGNVNASFYNDGTFVEETY